MLAPHRNPILYREWRIATRPGKLLATTVSVAVLLVIALVYLLAQASYGDRCRYGQPDLTEVLRQFGTTVLVAQFFIAFYAAFGSALDSIGGERLRKSHEFLVTLPISPVDKVVGLAVGSSLLPMMICVALTPIAVLSLLAGGVGAEKLLWAYAFLTVGFLAAAFVGVAASNALGKGRGGWIIALLAMGFSLIGVGMPQDRGFQAVPLMTLSPFSLLFALLSPSSELATVFASGRYHFYRWAVPWQIAPLAFYVYLAALGLIAAAWSMHRIGNDPSPRAFPVVLYAVLQALLIGFFADSLGSIELRLETIAGYLMAFLVVLLFWSFVTTLHVQGMMPWTARRPHWAVRLFRDGLTDADSPPVVPLLVMWAMTVVSAASIDRLYWDGRLGSRIVLGGALLAPFLLAYYGVYLTGALLTRRGGGLAGFGLLIAVVGVPLLFATVRDMDDLVLATAIGVVTEGNALGETVRDGIVPGRAVASAALGLILLTIAALLAAWRLEVLRRLAPSSHARPRPTGVAPAGKT